MSNNPTPPDNARYANALCQFIGLADTMNVYMVAGRGTAKTSAAMAQRSMRVIDSLPRHNMSWVCPTYTSFYANVLPALVEGWNREGWVEGVHYVVNKKPPEHFKKPWRPVQSYKHTICIANGVVIYIVSMVRLESAAGNSYVHLFADECRLIIYERLCRLLPALRGMEHGTRSPYFLGSSFASDHPDEMAGDDPWILNGRKDMKPERIREILSASLMRNALLAVAPDTDSDIQAVHAMMAELDERLRRLRSDATLYLRVSSFVNAQVLGVKYFENLFRILSDEKIRVSVLSLPPSSGSVRSFYPSFRYDLHTYDDGEKDDIDVPEDLRQFHPQAQHLRYYDSNAPLEVSMDFGTNMISLIVSQSEQNGGTIRFIKNFYALRPQKIDDLVEEFLAFFSAHRKRIIYYYYDRAGNARRVGTPLSDADTFIRLVKSHPLYKDWFVKPESRDMGDIYHSQEFYLADAIFSRTIEGLPRVLIDRLNCRELVCSLRGAKVIERTDARGRKTIQKDKSSEKNFKTVDELPEKSTNLSDAFKYRICTRTNLRKIPSNIAQGFFPDALQIPLNT